MGYDLTPRLPLMQTLSTHFSNPHFWVYVLAVTFIGFLGTFVTLRVVNIPEKYKTWIMWVWVVLLSIAFSLVFGLPG